jgi:hypothetical protein
LPHVRQWLQDKETAIFGDFLMHGPTLTAAHRARRTALERCCRAPHGRAAEGITPRIEASTSAVALTTDAGVITPNPRLGPALVAQLRGTLPAVADCDTASAPGAQAPPACPWFDAWPGAGAVFAPRLLVAFGAQRDRDASAEDLHT